MTDLQPLPPGKKVFFLSDFHLGMPAGRPSRERELRIVRFLEEIRDEAAEIFILGDVFDFWFEYRHAVPRGFVRLQGKLAELSDTGIRIHYFTGNHDMWVFDYLPAEIGMTLYRKPVRVTIGEKRFYIGHGDALGPGDHGYKTIKRVFASRLCQWLFARLHPNLGIGLARFWSRRSRLATGNTDDRYRGDDREYLVQFCKAYAATDPVDYFVFGHRHLPIDMAIGTARYVNLGDWIRYNTFAVFDGRELKLERFDG